MRIAICGPDSDINKKVSDKFLETWSNYKSSETTPNKNINNSISNDLLIDQLNEHIDIAMKYTKTDNIIHNVSILDVLCNIFYHKAKEETNIDDVTLQKAINLTRTSLPFYDIVFIIPYLEKYSKIDENNEQFDYIQQLNNFYLAVQDTYTKNIPWLFDFKSIGGTAALIELFGSVEEMIQMIKLYINENGQPYGAEDSLISI